ncbi:MAG: hypothetical protein JSS35_11180 [Proteobacteria bacterium]|nr:hypothetical protein [Pseudomonadota bacterium]
MATEIVPFEVQHESEVRALNRRLEAGGSTWKFFEGAIPRWLPRGTVETAFREYFVARDEAGVHGAYCLKHQSFLKDGAPLELASVQGPVSEGIIERRYGLLALQMVRDMLAREPNLFIWGGSDVLAALLDRLGWHRFDAPILIRVTRAGRFLRGARFLQTSPRRTALLRAVASTGLAPLVFGFVHAALGLRHGGAPTGGAKAVEEPRFGAWADDIWAAARQAYGLIAVRDSETMNALLPVAGWPEATILRIARRDRTIGWAAVRDTQFQDDGRFGDLRVGSIIDSLAIPGEERAVVQAATAALKGRGVDAIMTHYINDAWIAAFQACGYAKDDNRRICLVSPPLLAELGENVSAGRFHLTLLDGDGPHGF